MPVSRTAIVTGAGSHRGIGRATAHRLAHAGWNIAVLDVDGTAAADAAEQIAKEHGCSTLGLAVDVTDEPAVDEAVTTVEASLPPVGALVNNAGITSPTPFLEAGTAEWTRIFDVNVTGTYHVTRRVVPGMVERGYGRVVNLSSVSAQRGGGVFGGVAYSTAKAALLGFTKALARELGPTGVTVNAVAPSLIDTDITGGRLSEERMARLIADVPVGRIGTVADVAAVIAFLCDDDASYLTGAVYDVNGGSHLH
jgi:NAD(P)-dependent dehydrogenase (short-subunit alcohol dehydrogenase family)